MKLNVDKVEIESSGLISENSFGISDMGFILHLLRNKIYSDIKKAICQEYACNARDAHREAGKGTQPIEITLPTYLDSNYRVRDFGNSISPENMVKVFIQYGASTKRTDNVQTGGFGIGCKTAFGYSDSFIINTYIKGVHRSYSAVIDDTRCGKLALLSETATTQKDGTEIVVPVQPSDVSEFVNQTRLACRHWTVKPIIRGGTIDFEDFSKRMILEGTDWFLAKSNSGNRETRLVVDGIEYPFDSNCLSERVLNNFGYGTVLFLKFPVGVISISANREAVETDEPTKMAVIKALRHVKLEIKDRFAETIKDAKSFIEANIALQNMTHSLNMPMPDDVTWNGYKLEGPQIRFNTGSVMTYTRGSKKGALCAIKSSRWTESAITMTLDSVYCLTDLDFNAISERGATEILKKFPNAQRVVMVRLTDKTEILKRNFNLLNPVNVVDYYTAKQRAASLGRLTFYKFETDTGHFSRSSMKQYEEDKNQKIWCSLSKQAGKGPPMVLLNNTNCNETHFTKFANTVLKDYSIYGFAKDIAPEKIEEATEEMTKLEDFITTRIESEKIDMQEVYAAHEIDNKEITLFDSGEEKNLLDNIAQIKNPKSPLITYLNENKKFQEKITELRKYAVWLFTIKTDPKTKTIVHDVKALSAETTKAYPLFKHMTRQLEGRYGYARRDFQPTIEDILLYVNTVDAAAGKI